MGGKLAGSCCAREHGQAADATPRPQPANRPPRAVAGTVTVTVSSSVAAVSSSARTGTESLPLFAARQAEQRAASQSPPRKRAKAFSSYFWSEHQREQSFEPRVSFLQAIAAPSTTLDKYVRTIIEEVCRVLAADKCSIFFVNEARKEVWCVGALDMEPFNMPWDKGIVGQVALSGEVFNLRDAHSHDAFDNTVEKRTGYIAKSMLSVPIKHIMDAQRTIGVIQVLNKLGTGHFTDTDMTELMKITLLIGDSFHRQHWKALRRSLLEDTEASSLISHAMLRSSDECLDATTSAQLEVRSVVSESPLSNAPSVARATSSVLGLMSSGSFNALDHTEDMLQGCVPLLLSHSKGLKNLSINTDKVQAWADAVRRMYRIVPFHNWYHAFSVFQFSYYQFHASDITAYLRDIDIFASLIAALSHDLDHPGFTNNYMVDSQSDLALTYNDMSVLENHHASLACKLLKAPQTAIADELDAPLQKALRQVLIAAILATDMARHSEICQEALTDMTRFTAESATDRQLLVNLCLHSADLSAQVLPWRAACAWEQRISEEFRNQACLEEAAGQTPAAFMRFSLDDLKQRGKLQCDFIDFVLVPLWDVHTQVIPALRPCWDALCSNRAKYEHRKIHGEDEADDEELEATAE